VFLGSGFNFILKDDTLSLYMTKHDQIFRLTEIQYSVGLYQNSL